MLRLHKPKTEKAVKWKEGTVDNEFLGKKTSKCETANVFVFCLRDYLTAHDL